jgi:hypothetical protein
MKIARVVLFAILALPGWARAQSPGEYGVLVACVYECKPGPSIDTGGTPVATWQELTTIMLTQTSDNSSCARTFYFDGNQNLVAISNIGLSPFDLDELNVCHTLDAGLAGPVPQAGLVVFGSIAPGGGLLPQYPPFPRPFYTNVYAWGQNVLGKFRADNPEPFQGRADAVGNYECRVVPNQSSGYFGFNSLNNRTNGPAVPVIPPILIEQTAEVGFECGP